jgi:hypothetical protein
MSDRLKQKDYLSGGVLTVCEGFSTEGTEIDSGWRRVVRLRVEIGQSCISFHVHFVLNSFESCENRFEVVRAFSCVPIWPITCKEPMSASSALRNLPSTLNQ